MEHYGRPIYCVRGRVRAHVVEVQPHEAEFASIQQDFCGTGFDVACVARVQNERSLARYEFTRHQMWDDAGPDPPHERDRLYHMTQWSNLDLVYADGLDQRLSKRGLFGRGIYLSDSPNKCNNYWRGAEVNGLRFMLRCRALVGHAKVFPPGCSDRSLCREPVGFDSVQGNVSGQNEFVFYENNQVLVEYVVGYTVAHR